MNRDNFFSKLLFAYGPALGKKNEERKELRKILNRIRKQEKLLFDPVQLKIKPDFSLMMSELSELSNRLKGVFAENLEAEEEELHNFKRSLAEDILRRGKLTLEDLKLSEILKAAQAQSQAGINSLDRIFKSRLKIFSHKDFKLYNRCLTRNMILNDLVQFNYNSVLQYASLNKNGLYGSFGAEDILSNLQDLCYISSLIPGKEDVQKDPVIQKAFEMLTTDSSYSQEDFQNDLHRLIDIYKSSLNNTLLKNMLLLTTRNPAMEFREKEYKSDFPKTVYEEIVEVYRIDREKFIQREEEKLLKRRMNNLFQGRPLLGIEVYSQKNSELFLESGLPAYKYIIPMRIIKSYMSYFYNSQISPVLKEIELEAEFIEKVQKVEYQGIVSEYENLLEKIGRFEEDLSIPSFSELLRFVEVLNHGFLDNREKSKARKAVRNVNERADEIIQMTFKTSINLHIFLSSISVDINAKDPKILSNALFLSHKKDELTRRLEGAVTLFDSFIKLLRIFAVHMDTAQQSVVAQ